MLMRGVIVILSLVCQIIADSALLPFSFVWFVRIGLPLLSDFDIGGVLFLDVASRGYWAQPSSRTNLIDLAVWTCDRSDRDRTAE